MTVIVVVAWRLAGPRVAVFTGAALAYLALFGLWETSMVTVSLLGAAAFLCVLIGIPAGDLVRQEPARLQRGPAGARFHADDAGVRLPDPDHRLLRHRQAAGGAGHAGVRDAAGHPADRAGHPRGAGKNTKEAATAFGCTRWTLLKDIEIPLAMPSIMTGVNQTILMCLSMVVIASLIGAKGLGQDVLIALQYAAKGQGMLAGLAILFCAMVIDRIVQGHYKRSTARHRPGR